MRESRRLLQCCPDTYEVTEPGVFAVEINVPDASKEHLQRDWLQYYETLPPYFTQLVDCSRHIYVGAGGNVRSELDDTLNKRKRKASLPYVFGVEALLDAWWYDSEQDAEEARYNHAAMIDKETVDETYVNPQ